MRALLSFGAAYTAEWAFTVAISLVAYADGGVVAVGLVGLLRLVPAALLAPAVAAYADRLPREKVLFASSAVRGLATVLTAPVLLLDGPTWIVYALAIVSTIAFTPYRASHSALMPLLCRAPEELTSINVVRGLLDSLSVVVGPFVAAVLIGVADVASVFVFAGGCGMRVGDPGPRPDVRAGARGPRGSAHGLSPRSARGCAPSPPTRASRW